MQAVQTMRTESSLLQNFKELCKYRALLSALVVRHLAVRYRGSVLGFLWSILNPLFLMLVYLLVFHYYIRFTSVEHYAIFLFCGLLPWTWTVSALNEGTSAIVSSGHLITKSLFPAQILPVVAVITSLINFLLSLPLLFIFMYFDNIAITPYMLLLPVVILLQFIFLTGLTLALSALNVRFRDVQHLLGNVLSLLFFLCPIVYSASVVPERLRFTLYLNPFALFTQTYHMILLDKQLPSPELMLYLLVTSLVALIIGNMIFNSLREGFAEAL